MTILGVSPVLPVVVIDDAESAVPLAHALLAGGIGILEVTLRTPSALSCIERIASEVPDVIVGAGTLTNRDDIDAAVKAGAQFLVSPGTTREIAAGMLNSELPALPGCSTVREALLLRDLGFEQLKFFPAAACGGPAFLAAAQGPLPDLRFCPTGGVTLESAPSYLALSNVPCVGGTWVAPPQTIAEHGWSTISRNAADALSALAR